MPIFDLVRRVFASPQPERRDAVTTLSPDRAWNLGAPIGSGYYAENLAAVVAGITLISRTLASLPVLIYRDTPEGRVEQPDHPVARLLKRPDGPDGILTWPDFCEWFVSSALFSGNGLAAIEDDGRGVPVRLRPIPWASSNPQISPTTGRVSFHVAQAGSLPWWPTYAPQVISSSDVLWLRDRTDSGVIGRSALSRAPQVVAAAMATQNFSASTFSQGAKLSGSLTFPGRLGETAMANIAQSWRDTHAGPSNSGKAVILEEGGKFEALSMTLEDAQLLASRKFETEEIARLLNIPLPLLNIWDHSTFTNSDTASQWFGQLTLTPWIRKLEAEVSRTLLNDPRDRLEIDLSALMRGSFATRIQTEIAMVRAGVLTPNEMRLSEGWPALPGGDKLMPQSVGGKPPGTQDGTGADLPDLGPTGSGTGNGQTAA